MFFFNQWEIKKDAHTWLLPLHVHHNVTRHSRYSCHGMGIYHSHYCWAAWHYFMAPSVGYICLLHADRTANIDIILSWYIKLYIISRLMGVWRSYRLHFRRRQLWSKMAPKSTLSEPWAGRLEPCCGGGARWRLFRFRPPSWKIEFQQDVLQTSADAEMRSSKISAGSGSVTILHNHHKAVPILLMAFNKIDIYWVFSV